MRAIQLVAAGAPLQERTVPDPEPGWGEIVVRVEAAGICRSDMHYRAGFPVAGPLPLTPGHEVAGTVAEAGSGVDALEVGDRVALHYLVTCGACRWCTAGTEQFCADAQMLGKDRHGGYAEFVVVPARNAHTVPDGVPIEHASVIMCSTATAYHALRQGRVGSGDRVVIFGVGGLGMAAVQLAGVLGAEAVYAVDVDPAKLATARRYGAVPIEGGDGVAERIVTTAGGPVTVALDLVGSASLLRTGMDIVEPRGRVVAVGLTSDDVAVEPYRHLVAGERMLVGCSDHLAAELTELLDMAAAGRIVFDDIVTAEVALDANEINGVLDALAASRSPVRTVIRP